MVQFKMREDGGVDGRLKQPLDHLFILVVCNSEKMAALPVCDCNVFMVAKTQVY